MAATAALRPKPDLSAIYRLADHLDATLAMGEDLLQQSFDIAPPALGDTNVTIASRQRSISDFARTVRALELGMTARLLQARTRAIEVRAVHLQFAPLIGLFVGGTAPLADCAADGELGDISGMALATGPDVLAFLTSRALIDTAASSLAGVSKLHVTDGYLLSAHIHLGTLMDMIAQFIDTLDLAFDLYADAR